MGEDIRHAIVYGASGLIGWALVDQLLNSYPTIRTFSKVTAVTNRPLNVERSCWPEASPSRPKLQLVSGVNLQSGDGDWLAKSLQASVKDVETVTHIFYLGELEFFPKQLMWLIRFVYSLYRHGR
jgi:nucleoside-diphosphate-sugar epimerase